MFIAKQRRSCSDIRSACSGRLSCPLSAEVCSAVGPLLCSPLISPFANCSILDELLDDLHQMFKMLVVLLDLGVFKIYVPVGGAKRAPVSL